MHRQAAHRESNPHFFPRRNNDPIIEFPTQSRHPAQPLPVGEYSPPPHAQSKPHVTPHPPPRHESLTDHSTPPDPRHGSRPPHLGPQTHEPHHESGPPHFVSQPQAQHESRQPYFAPHSPGSGHGHSHVHSPQHSGRRHHHRRTDLQMPESKKTKPFAWLVAAVCALFWILVIIGGLVILIVYLVFRPRNPRFDISTATFNAAYLDMGYLLNADVTVLANFTNPNTKVNVDFTYIVLDIYYEKRFVATRYIEPFSVMRRESRFADVHMVASQVALSPGHSLELQRQIAAGRVNFEIRGLFKTRSRFGGFFQYTYWLYAHCQLVVAGPPTGVLIGKRCVTKQ